MIPRLFLVAVLMATSLLTVAAPAAAATVDDACMKRYVGTSLTYSERVSRCTVKSTTLNKWGPTSGSTGSGYVASTDGVSSGDYGFWGWEYGTAVWEVVVKVGYHRKWRVCAPVNGCGYTWVVDSVNCYVRFSYLVSVNIDTCSTWNYNGFKEAGAYFRVTFGPVTESFHSLLVLPTDGYVVRNMGKN